MAKKRYFQDLPAAAFGTYRNNVMRWMAARTLSEAAEKHIVLGWNRGYDARRTANEILTTPSLLGGKEKGG